MSTREPWFAALLCCTLTATINAPDLRAGAEQQQTQPAAESDAKPLLDRFLDSFADWRRGDANALEPMRSLAAALCAQEQRCDIPRLVEHYARLSVQERVEGLAFEQAVQALRTRITDEYASEFDLEEWPTQRAGFERELDAVCAASRNIADRGARAKAPALRAECFVSWLEPPWGDRLDPQERARLSAQVELDARFALADYEDYEIVRGTLIPRFALARIEHFRGKLASAQVEYEKLADAAAAVHNDDLLAEAYRGMLRIARDRGDEPERERCLAALARFSDPREDWPLARDWAMWLINCDRPTEARDFLEKFRAPDALDKSLDAKRTRREHAFVLAEANLHAGLLPQARDAAALAALAAAALATRAGATLSDSVQASFEQLFLEASLELANGQAQAAIARLADPKTLAGLRANQEGAARTLLGEARLALGDARKAAAELKRALALGESERLRVLAEPLLSLDDARRFNLIGEWEGAGLETVALLARAHLELGDPIAAALASADWQSRSLRGAEGKLAELRVQAGDSSPREALTMEQLAAWAACSELGLVTWIIGADSGAVVHVKACADGKLDGKGARLDLGREALREALRRLRERAIAGGDCSALAREIRDVLLPPEVLAHVDKPRSRGDRLLFLLHGPLESAPVELLGLEQGPFDDEICLVALPGLPAADPGLAATAAQLADWRLLGAPLDGAQGEGPPVWLLSGAREELESLGRMRPKAEIALGGKFDRSSLERALLSNDCLHVATHLEVKPGAARSRFPAAGLRLCDGDVISANEIADMGPRLPLVVLSACETGGGRYADGEGLFGVARAFLEGGTRNLVVTLWPVEDGAARDFSLAFHRGLDAGMRPSQAASAARTALRSGGRSSADWAAFRFLGRD